MPFNGNVVYSFVSITLVSVQISTWVLRGQVKVQLIHYYQLRTRIMITSYAISCKFKCFMCSSSLTQCLLYCTGAGPGKSLPRRCFLPVVQHRLLLVSRFGLGEENAVEVFHHYGVHLSSSFLCKISDPKYNESLYG